MYGRLQYGAIDDRPAYGGGSEPMAAYTQSSLGSSGGGGLPSRSYPMEQDRYAGQMGGGGQLSSGHPSGLEEMSMGNGAGRGAVGYPQQQAMSSANDGRGLGFPASSHMPSYGGQDRGFSGYGYGR